jgi:hypothetical protein
MADITRVEDILHLDPTPRGLPARERAQRWDEILDRVLDSAVPCGTTPQIDKARSLAKKPAVSIDATDQKMTTVLGIWKSLPDGCRQDVVLSHILAKLIE